MLRKKLNKNKENTVLFLLLKQFKQSNMLIYFLPLHPSHMLLQPQVCSQMFCYYYPGAKKSIFITCTYFHAVQLSTMISDKNYTIALGTAEMNPICLPSPIQTHVNILTSYFCDILLTLSRLPSFRSWHRSHCAYFSVDITVLFLLRYAYIKAW